MEMTTVSFKRIAAAALAAVMVIAALMPAEVSFAAVKKYTSKGNALARYKSKDYKPVKNKKLTPRKIKSYHIYEPIFMGKKIEMPHILRKTAGTKNIDLQTLFHLPKAWKGDTLDLGNPQALCVTPDGNTAYITYPTKKNSTKGFIVKYDMAGLRKLGLNIPGMMNEMRIVGKYPGRSNFEREIKACIEVGPTFELGHGAAFSYNPKDGCLWFVAKTKETKTDLWRVNMDTLKPDLCINYTFDKKITFGNNITFDKNGKFYLFGNASSKQGKCPKDAIKVYQGTINLKAKKKVSVKLMMNVIKYPVAADHNVQAAGYDPKNNRIYMVCNSALLSVPVAKLVKKALKPSDVWMTQFDVDREFEDFELDKDGNYYLLVNKYPEIMTQMDLAHWNLKESDFNKYGEYIGPDDYWYDPTQGGDDPTQGGDDPTQGGDDPTQGGDDPTQNPNGTDDPTQGGDAN